MDAKDVRIFCEMAFTDQNHNTFTARHVSPSGIGRKLGLDEKTVRLRVKRMEDTDFIKYYQATPSITLFGMKCQGTYRFEAMNIATKYGVVKFIHDLFGVVEAFDYLGPTISISMAGTSPKEIQELAEQVAGKFELTKMSLGDHPLRDSRSRPDRLDWQIIEKLRYDAHATAKEVADALSITPRMSGYRIERLIDSGVVLIRPVINTQKQEGLVFYTMIVSVEISKQDAVVRTLQETRGKKLWSMQVTPNGVLLVNLFGFTLAEPEEAAMDLLAIEGVKWCSISILKEVIEPKRPNWIDVLIRKQVGTSI